MYSWKRRDRNVWKGLASGIIGGLAASYVMNQFQALLKKLATQQSDTSQSAKQHRQQQGKQQQGQEGSSKKEPATVKAAEAISENVFGHQLTKDEKKEAGPAVHYAMGASSGAIYGLAAELHPKVTTGAGLPFGAAVWLMADAVAVPAFGLSKPPWEFPLSMHTKALAAHFVYGLTTDTVRRAVRRTL